MPISRSVATAVTAAGCLMLLGGAAPWSSPSSASGTVQAKGPGWESASYALTATLGETEVPGRLELRVMRDGAGARGRLTLHVGRALHFGVRSVEAESDTVVFLTSAPAREMRLSWDGARVAGSLDLGGGRIVSLAGARDGPYPDTLEHHFALAPVPDLEPPAARSGRAFPTLTETGDRIFFSQYENGDFTRQTIMTAAREGDGWAAAEVAAFSGTHSDRAPMLDAATGALYFSSTRPLPGTEEPAASFNLWRIAGWASHQPRHPQPLAGVASDRSDYQPSLTSAGTLFFVSQRGGNQDIYTAARDGDGWSTPQALPPPINTDDDEMSVFAAPDGSYIIFSSGHEGAGHVGNEDLYISRPSGDGWSPPRNLGLGVNSFANEYGAFVSPDGAWLYFTSDRYPPARLYRVPAPSALDGAP